MAWLVLDVGNTRLKWALYQDAAAISSAPLAQGAEFLENIGTLSETAWLHLPAPTRIIGCIVAGAAIKQQVQEQLETWSCTPEWVVPSAQESGLINHYDHPVRLGADRWMAILGAWAHMRHRDLQQPLVVVMVGTAVTVEAVSEQGEFLGGIILPGHGIMLSSLLRGTAGLHVPTGEVKDFPTNTSDALTSGGTFAIAGAVALMVQNLEARCAQKALCYMTGGAAWKMAPNMACEVVLIDRLIFDGLLHWASAHAMPSEKWQ